MEAAEIRAFGPFPGRYGILEPNAARTSYRRKPSILWWCRPWPLTGRATAAATAGAITTAFWPPCRPARRDRLPGVPGSGAAAGGIRPAGGQDRNRRGGSHIDP
jgi:hypothetical protein